MRLETVIGLADQPLVKSLFADPGFIPRNEQDCLALRVEGEGYSPFAISRTEPQFLQRGASRSACQPEAGPKLAARTAAQGAPTPESPSARPRAASNSCDSNLVANLNPGGSPLQRPTPTGTYDCNIIPSGNLAFRSRAGFAGRAMIPATRSPSAGIRGAPAPGSAISWAELYQ